MQVHVDDWETLQNVGLSERISERLNESQVGNDLDQEIYTYMYIRRMNQNR